MLIPALEDETGVVWRVDGLLLQRMLDSKGLKLLSGGLTVGVRRILIDEGDVVLLIPVGPNFGILGKGFSPEIDWVSVFVEERWIVAPASDSPGLSEV